MYLLEVMFNLRQLLGKVQRGLLFASQALLPGLQVALLGYQPHEFGVAPPLLVAQVQPQGSSVPQHFLKDSLALRLLNIEEA